MAKESLIEKIKENKKIHDAKIEAATKMVDEAAGEFSDVFISLISECSKEEFEEFISTDDEFFEEDVTIKLMAIRLFCSTHDCNALDLRIKI